MEYAAWTSEDSKSHQRISSNTALLHYWYYDIRNQTARECSPFVRRCRERKDNNASEFCEVVRVNLAAVYAMLLREIPDDDILLAIFFDPRTKGFWFSDDLDRRAALLRTAEAAVHRVQNNGHYHPTKRNLTQIACRSAPSNNKLELRLNA